MQTTTYHIELANSLHDERSGRRYACSVPERSPTLRARLGRRLIALGERLAGNRTATAPR